MNLYVELLSHPKYLQLRQSFGAKALEYLVRIWGHCAANKRGERWLGCTGDYVETVAQFRGRKGTLFAKLVELRFVDIIHAGPPVDGNEQVAGVVIHDWEETNYFIVKNWTRNPTGKKRLLLAPSDSDGPPSGGPQGVGSGLPSGGPHLTDDRDDRDGRDAPPPSQAEIPSEPEFLDAFMSDGMAAGFLKKQFERFHTHHEWLTPRGLLVDWKRVVRHRWTADLAQWGPEKNSGPPLGAPTLTLADMMKAIRHEP